MSTRTTQSPMRRGHGPSMGIGMAEKTMNFKGSSKRLLGRLRPHRLTLILVLALTVVAVVLSVIAPRVLGAAVDEIYDGVIGRRSVDFDEVGRILAIVVGLYVVAAVAQLVQGFLLAKVVQRTVQRLRDDVEAKVNRLPLAYLDGQPRGEMLSRVTNDIDNVGQSMQQSISQLLFNGLTVIGVVVMMVSISWWLTIVAVLAVPVVMVVTAKVMKKSQGLFVQQWQHTGELNAQIEETFSAHDLVKVFGRGPQVQATFRAKNDELTNVSWRAQFVSGLVMPIMMFVGNLQYVIVCVLGGVQVANGGMSLGQVTAFIQYSRQFTQPITQLASMVNLLQSGVASAERVFEVLDAPEEPADAAGRLSPARGKVTFEDVSFSYGEEPLIEHLDLEVEPGQTVAIVGPTGAGKTTLVNLLMRFYDIDSGRITLDGRDIRDVPRTDLRSRIGMVLQDTWLFHGTIGENIAYGNPNATEADVLEAAQATFVDRFVHSLPDGYDTVVDEDGTNVSTGERQLITIARAFVADPALLILDEATSSVDTRTEVLVQHAMAALRANRTSFVIAHRLSTIRDADVILVMDRGRIVETGDHERLLALGGVYSDLYASQFEGVAT
ncbi:ATP-binding cassette subfamily B protein [Yimella lutea]|uniref:Fatty acid ABC transporter ATP-binding/permease protein n=1 Tax=Yimella lutea TaxID=587872 RepID=A0A542ED56_9MICO|nr:ABC transporter ATP-binding protein [Yimella lutea]TQJ13245.1 ATP-binding cassette subfamily B protein [Yimella lutea]